MPVMPDAVSTGGDLSQSAHDVVQNTGNGLPNPMASGSNTDDGRPETNGDKNPAYSAVDAVTG